MTLWHFVLILYYVLLLLVIRYLVIILRLFRLRYVAKDYNRYVDQQYIKVGKSVPAFIGRIQYDYINQHNEFLGKRQILQFLFKPLPLRGKLPAKKNVFFDKT